MINTVTDFRNKYFKARDETRKEKRTREAAIREQNRLEAVERSKLQC